MAMLDTIHEVIMEERSRQAVKWDTPHTWGYGDCSSPAVTEITKSAVLSEECGEVAQAVLQRDDAALEKELVQVAAVAVAWLECIHARKDNACAS